MNPPLPLWELIPSSSFLEYAFLRWVLAPAATPEIVAYTVHQAPVETVADTAWITRFAEENAFSLSS